MAIKALELDYKTAFQIACALLNGDNLYGTDAESIFSEIMKKDGCVCSFDYENYILTHLNELRDDKVLSQEPCDAVSREALLKIIDKWYENKSDIEDLIILITYMQSVTVRQTDDDPYQTDMDEAWDQTKRDCSTCKYEHNVKHNQPCRDCGTTLLESYTNWEQKEKEQKPCDDAVSRDGVYSILWRLDFRDRCGYEDFKKRLEALPSVTPKLTEDVVSRDEVHKILWKAIENLEDLPSLTNGGGGK